MGVRCRHCGKDLEEVGVIELRGYLEYPDAKGEIPFDNRLSRPLDDTEGYRCAHCNAELSFSDGQESTKVFGE